MCKCTRCSMIGCLMHDCVERAERHLTEMTKMFKRAQRNYEQLGGTVEDVVTINGQHDLERYIYTLYLIIAVAPTV